MKKKTVNQQNEVFLFFVFAALVMVFGLVLIGQMRDARFDARLSSIEDSVMRIEAGVGSLMGVVGKYDKEYEKASNFSQQLDTGIEVGVGDRKKEVTK